MVAPDQWALRTKPTMEAGGGLCGRINKHYGRQEEVRFQTPMLGSREQKEGVSGSAFREFGLNWVSTEAQ